MRYDVRYACVSHIGKVRRHHQDNYICDGKHLPAENTGSFAPLTGCVTTNVPSMFGVFDGMGGEERGDLAAHLAATTAAGMEFGDSAILDLIDFCSRANDTICQYTRRCGLSSMGTTAALVLLKKHKITVCNLGDSKVFRFSKGALRQLSEDHVGIAVYGKKPPLYQYLGIPPEHFSIEPQIVQFGLKHGERYLLCSDGLTDMLSVEEIGEILAVPSAEAAASELVARALAHGGHDNVTVIVLEIRRHKNTFFKSDKGDGTT